MKKIILHGRVGKGKVALIDDEDYPIINLFRWYNSKSRGYDRAATSVRLNGKQYLILMSRLIMKVSGPLVVDHKYHDTLDNRKENLRICTHRQNMMNSIVNRGSSKYKGVSWFKRDKKWMAYIRDNKSIKHLGMFYEEEAAAQAYDIMAKKLYGEYALYNNIGVNNG